MFVKIGKYCNYYGSYHIADLLQYIGFPEDRCHKIGEYLSNTWAQKFLEWVDSFKKRKVKVKIHNYDIWSMDHTLSYIILPMLKMVKDGKYGAPYVDDSDVPEELKSTNTEPKEHDYDVDSLHFKRWYYVLDQMIWSFEQIQDDNWESQYHSGVIDFKFVQCEDNPNLSEMVNGPNDTHVFDREGYEKHQAKISNGLRLFGRYFQNLWT